MTPVSQAPNGICYAASGEITVPEADLQRMVSAVPDAAAAALKRKAYYFVPLTVNQGDETVIADRYDVALATTRFAIATSTWAIRSAFLFPPA